MERLRDLFTKEPALIIGLVISAIGLASAAGLTVTEQLAAAIVVFVGALVALVGFLLARQSVYSPHSVEREKYRAFEEGYVEGHEEAEKTFSRRPPNPPGRP